MKTPLSYQSCFNNLCRYVLHKQQWELLPSPTQMHRTACLKNLKTGKIYKVMERNTHSIMDSENQVTELTNLPEIFLKVFKINEETYLMEKPCRSLAALTFNPLNQSRSFFTEEEIKNTLAPIFKSSIDQNFPWGFQIRRENIVVDYFGKVRFIHPLFASKSHHEPSLSYSLQGLVFILVFGDQFKGRCLRQFCSEEGYCELVASMGRKSHSNEFIVFVVALLHFPITKKQLETYANFVDGFESMLNDEKVGAIRQWVQEKRKINDEEREGDEDRKQIQKVQQILQEQNGKKRYLLRLERTEVKKNLYLGPHGSKYRGGIRLKKVQQSSSDEQDNSFLSHSLSKTQLTEQDSRSNPQNISM